MLNNNKAKEVRLYYLKLEKVFTEYSIYCQNFEKEKEIKIIQEKFNEELSLKDKEIEVVNKKNLRINKFLNNVTIQDKKLEWIYIASTDVYQQEKLYKIGSTTRLQSRLSNYNTGRVEEFYYIWVKKTYNSKEVDYVIQNLLKDFKYKENREMYYGIYIYDLIDIINFIIDNHDSSKEYIINFVKNKLEESIGKENESLPPLKFYSTKKNDIEENVNIEDENRNLVVEELINFLETIEDGEEISRKKLLNVLNIDLQKNYIWSCIKEYTKWTTSKDLLKYKTKKFTIIY